MTAEGDTMSTVADPAETLIHISEHVDMLGPMTESAAR
jgi:hypothetical protein